MTTPPKRTSAPAHEGPRAPLPAERAFVVQLRADADLTTGAVSGRIEHVRSGAAALFESVDQLIAWMRQAVAHNQRRE